MMNRERCERSTHDKPEYIKDRVGIVPSSMTALQLRAAKFLGRSETEMQLGDHAAIGGSWITSLLAELRTPTNLDASENFHAVAIGCVSKILDEEGREHIKR
jgi:hypothetical protein